MSLTASLAQGRRGRRLAGGFEIEECLTLTAQHEEKIYGIQNKKHDDVF